MVSYKELFARVKKELRYDKQEIIGIIALVLVSGFIFSFRDWGEEQFNLAIGLQHLILAMIIVGISLLFRLSCQKIYGLVEAHKAKFKIWWMGIIIALIMAFVTNGKITLMLAGTMSVSLMVRLRLGEYRYGFSYGKTAIISWWGIVANLILAALFGICLYLVPESYFFKEGLIINIIMAWCALLPLPQLDGLSIYFGSRTLYFIAILVTLIVSALVLTQTKVGLILAVVLGLVAGTIYIIKGSEK